MHSFISDELRAARPRGATNLTVRHTSFFFPTNPVRIPQTLTSTMGVQSCQGTSRGRPPHAARSHATRTRDASMLSTKQQLRRLLGQLPRDSRLKYVDHVDGSGTALFQRVCKLDLEGIVAKQKSGPYTTDREASTWFKIRNPEYSQMAGREELFERERHQEPVAGWHACVLASAKLEEGPN